MTVWFGVGRRLNRLDVADTAWGGGFIVVATISLILHSDSRTLLIWAMVVIWGLRLASHIWRRNANKGPDPRYVDLSRKWPAKHFWYRAFIYIFMTQAGLIALVSLPITTAALGSARLIGGIDYLAIILWLTGFIFEATADRQLSRFIGNSANRGKILCSGLWKYSRHPNYFGEILQWWAIALLALGPAIGWLGLAGPVLLTYLIVFVSGIPPIEKRHRQNPKYTDYMMRTSMIVPLPRRQH